MARRSCTGAEINNNTSTGEFDSVTITTPTGTGGTPSASFTSDTTHVHGGGQRSWLATIVEAGTVTTPGAAFGTVSTNVPAGTTFAIYGAIYIPVSNIFNGDPAFWALQMKMANAAYFAQGLIFYVAGDSFDTQGHLKLGIYGIDGTGAVGGAAEFSGLNGDQWHTFCIKGSFSEAVGATSTADLRIDQLGYKTCGAIGYAAATTGIASFNVGFPGTGAAVHGINGATITVWMDDLIIDDAYADIPDYVAGGVSGQRSLILLQPDQDDVNGNSGWAIFGGSATKHAAISDQSDSTGIRASALSATEDVGLSDVTASQGGTVVTAYATERHGNTADTIGYTLSLRKSDGSLVGSAATLAQATTATTNRAAVVAAVSSQYLQDVAGWFLRFLSASAGSLPQVSIEEAWVYAEVVQTNYVAALAESISIGADAVARALNQTRSRSESSSVSDAPARAFQGARTPADSIATTDAVVRTASFPRSPGDTLVSPSDLVARAAAQSRSLTEAFPALSEAWQRVFAGTRNVPESEPALADAVTRGVVGQRTLNETTSVFDGVARQLMQSRTLSEAFPGAADTWQRVFAGGRSVLEALLAPADLVTRAFTGSRTPSESVTTTDVVTRSGSTYFRALTEAFPTPVDFPAWTRIVIRAVSEILGLSDAVARLRGASRPVPESVAVADVPSRTVGLPRTVVETSAVGDSVTRRGTFARVLTETTFISDFVGPLPKQFIVWLLTTRDMIGSLAARTMTLALSARDLVGGLRRRDMQGTIQSRDAQDTIQTRG